MQRTELIDAVVQVKNALESAGILIVLQSALRRSPDKNETAPDVFASFQKYSSLWNAFSPAALQVTKLYELSPLISPDFWASLSRGPSPSTMGIYEAVQTAQSTLPLVINLLAQTSTSNNNDLHSKGFDTITIIVIEEDDRYSSVARISEALDGIQVLYSICCVLNDLPEQSLGLVSCDSGSDKVFTLLGLVPAIVCLKEVIVTIWDKIIFHKEYQMLERVRLISESLPVVEKISLMQADGSMQPEVAMKLKQNILLGVGKFIESGITTPEIEKEHSYYNPRLLMAPAPKLLTNVLSPSEVQESETITNLGNTNRNANDLNMSPEDLEKLADLLAKKSSNQK